MSTYNVLEWVDENSLSGFPLAEEIEIQNFIVSANFIQFDGFVPILNKIFVNNDSILIDITFDFGQLKDLTFTQQQYDSGEEHQYLRIYTPNQDRYLGMLRFGVGAKTLWTSYVGRKFEYSLAFLNSTVRSIPSNCGVYSLDGNYGNITLAREESDASIFYNISTAKKSVTFNAVYGHSVPNSALGGLRKINLVSPVRNNINLSSNDVIKITSLNGAALSIDLVSGTSTASFSPPTLFS